MLSVFARGYTQRPVVVETRECNDDTRLKVGDSVTVCALGQDVTFSIRLTGPGATPGNWRGTIFYIALGEQSVPYAEGLEVDDIVEVARSEIFAAPLESTARMLQPR